MELYKKGCGSSSVVKNCLECQGCGFKEGRRGDREGKEGKCINKIIGFFSIILFIFMLFKRIFLLYRFSFNAKAIEFFRSMIIIDKLSYPEVSD